MHLTEKKHQWEDNVHGNPLRDKWRTKSPQAE